MNEILFLTWEKEEGEKEAQTLPVSLSDIWDCMHLRGSDLFFVTCH